jgi:hypothetical protein
MRISSLLRCLACVTFVGACVACSSSSDSGGTTDAGKDTGGTGDTGDPDNCVPPGSKGNELGMGGYCSPGGGECNYAGPDGGARICTADVPDTPAHAWFCTYPCNLDTDCGSGSYCATDPKTHGKGCVPVACKYLQPDAGTPDTSTADSAASDATGDGSGD